MNSQNLWVRARKRTWTLGEMRERGRGVKRGIPAEATENQRQNRYQREMLARNRPGAGSKDLIGEVEAGEDQRNDDGNPNSRTVHALMDPSPAKPSHACQRFLRCAASSRLASEACLEETEGAGMEGWKSTRRCKQMVRVGKPNMTLLT